MIFPYVTTYSWLGKNYTFVEHEKLDKELFRCFRH
jgi:hypothetical protein